MPIVVDRFERRSFSSPSSRSILYVKEGHAKVYLGQRHCQIWLLIGQMLFPSGSEDMGIDW